MLELPYLYASKAKKVGTGYPEHFIEYRSKAATHTHKPQITISIKNS
jgi:hypothetical protein